MTAATAQIAEGHFETQLPFGRKDELGELSASIGRMASRLDRLVNGQKRFLRDAAHELRSPIARIQVALGLLERSAIAEQQNLITDLHDDVQHMSELVDNVLSFSRAGLPTTEPRTQDVQVASIVRRVVEREGSAGVHIAASITETLAVRADPEMLFRALSNVVRNAVRYAGTVGPIEISAKADGASVALSVTDCGPGVPEKDLDAIFEPFYRIESARQRATGGVGLGLAIVRSSVESCRGTVRCRNRQPAGLEVEIRLPAAERPQAGTEAATPVRMAGQTDHSSGG
jgi:two-component system sensor histidine kinase CpxA